MLEVHVSELNMRVSYNDIMLFLAILKSLPTQAGIKGEGMTTSPVSSSKKSSPSRIKAVFKPNEDVVNNLTELGYSRNDVIHALGINNGDVTRAGSWLVDHATLQPNAKRHMVPIRRRIPFDVARISVKVDVARVCLIDDCAEDCDVPLAEFAVHALQVRQGVDSKFERSLKDAIYGQMGSSTFKLTGDYYNRMLSLWEPFLEPWRCNISWQHEKSRSNQSRSGTWNLKVEASDRFDVSVTSALIDTVKKTKSTWQSDYELSTDGSKAKSSQSATSKRIRHPFVPYVIRNLTGCPLKFATQTAALHETDIVASAHRLSSAFSDSDWTEVQPGEDVSFHFATSHEKQRHKRTGLLKLHQIRVKVGEWKTLQPVTVSRVGVYFRHAFTQINKSSKVYESPVPVRVVFSVALEGSAQKVVTVRSALAVKSRVKIPIQIQLEKQDGVDTSIMAMPTLDPGETQYIPLSMTSFAMRLRPRVQKHGSYYYSTTQIRWQTCTGDTKEEPLLVECKPSQPAGEAMPFHFAVCIQQKGFPSYEEVYEMLAEQGEVMEHEFSEWSTNLLPHLPGHTVIILPPVVISNLLPCDLSYYVKNTSVEGTLKPGMDATPHVVSLLADEDNQPQSLIIGCLLENFKSCRELIVPATIKNFQMRMLIKDYNDQTLILNVRILWRLNCSVKISVMAGYWIVNTTGLPIIVRQDGCQQIAAGQYDTHEQARSLQPLLFSYAHRENTYLCTMRLGKKAQMETLTGKPRPGWNDDSNGGMRAIPSFCERFSTDGGSCTRNLKMVTHDGTPNREFYIGISVRRGWGRYLHTHIVTVAPRFLLINRTKSKRLSFAQRHTISYTTDSAGTNFHLTIVPGSSVVFHWPRVDLDTLLCVRLADEPSCHWSGGFFIDRTDAFHVAIRLASGRSGLIHEDVHPLAPHCIFLSVEVTLVNATYCISLSDADPSLVPPPLRIDNVSSAPVIFKQVGTDEGYNTEVPAETQLAYACDEPSFPYHLQCSVKGSSQQVTLDMSNIGFEKQLYYENFIYITVGLSPHQTFYSSQHNSGDILVLDVQAAHRGGHVITLQPLRTGKRSQLWRMTSDGRIFHVGSSPPDKDAPSKAPSSQRNLGLVLDIGEMAFAVGRSLDDGIPLALKQTDERRRSTQTWSFGEDGRLHCRHKNLCARAGDLRVGSVVVLATFNDQRVPLPNELCSRHKMISGSGVLSLKVVRDGPTRVLRVVDIRQKRAGIFSKESDWTVLESDKYVTNERNGEASVQPGAKFTASLSMSKGVGISLVSNTPEELLYLTMNGVQMEVSVVPGEQIFSLRIQKLQIDNQLLDGHPAVMLCPRNATTSFTSSSRSDSSSTDPLISVRAVRQPSSSRLYQIFKSFSIDVGRLTVQIEERLLLKLLHFVGYGPASSGRDSEVLDEAKMDLNRAICNVMDDSVATATRFYFDTIRLSAAPMRLSVITTSRLIPELKAVKRALRFSLVQFERAPVAIQAYAKRHLFETVAFILADFSKHLRDQLKGQAAKILGSVDFLGNPIGLLTDVRAGMTGLAKGNLPNMVKHITHGISDSTAKVVSTLSGGLGEITMDEDYEDKRRAIQSNAKNAGGHVVAGLQGFMAGMIGGLTSVITQPVRGAQSDGTRGFIKGIGKGLVGTVTKPVTGVLDLASESASAVREISVSSDQVYKRARPVRCCHTFQGCLQVYSETQANGQQFLYALNRNDFSEHFYSLNKLSFPHHDNMLVLITSHKVYFVKDSEPDPDHVVLEVEYSNLINVRILPVHSDQPHSSIRTHDGDKVLLELTVKQTSSSAPVSFHAQSSSVNSRPVSKPRVVCHSSTVAERVCQQVNYAKTIASEQTETLDCDPDEEEAEDRSFDLEV
uniref:Vacuolar protein sorting-associated protein 13D n=1 Tax=Phallusia mammillata TaxID=59560 RepID=A0A6F9DXC9_9ASCI|nr:vacuolar protein sorting-associated protein 13D [Phallusia mammillata]